jgi:hypothetical protein
MLLFGDFLSVLMGLRQPNPMTRFLLGLWSFGGVDVAVKQGDLMKVVRLGKERVADFAPIVADLLADGSIVVESVGRSKVYTLLALGMDRLRAGVIDPGFGFEGTVVGTRFVSLLLRFFREVVAVAPVGVVSVEVAPVEKIEDYEAFKPVLLDTYRELLARFNYNRLVPIYQIRRELGDRVDRETFNQWIIQAHKDDVLEMMDCGERDITPDEIADSVKPPFGRLWFFAIKR